MLNAILLALATREKAQALADTLGVRSGAPRAIEETLSGGIRPWAETSRNRLLVEGADPDDGGALPARRIRIRESVTVTFDLEAGAE